MIQAMEGENDEHDDGAACCDKEEDVGKWGQGAGGTDPGDMHVRRSVAGIQLLLRLQAALLVEYTAGRLAGDRHAAVRGRLPAWWGIRRRAGSLHSLLCCCCLKFWGYGMAWQAAACAHPKVTVPLPRRDSSSTSSLT